MTQQQEQDLIVVIKEHRGVAATTHNVSAERRTSEIELVAWAAAVATAVSVVICGQK